jgi:hypothetical protein
MALSLIFASDLTRFYASNYVPNPLLATLLHNLMAQQKPSCSCCTISLYH